MQLPQKQLEILLSLIFFHLSHCIYEVVLLAIPHKIIMANDVVNPKQQRSIEKRKKILEAGFKLFKQKGYYKTNTAEIAKEAGVSTGIVYRYFTDKKAIFIESMEQFFHEVYRELIINTCINILNE